MTTASSRDSSSNKPNSNRLLHHQRLHSRDRNEDTRRHPVHTRRRTRPATALTTNKARIGSASRNQAIALISRCGRSGGRCGGGVPCDGDHDEGVGWGGGDRWGIGRDSGSRVGEKGDLGLEGLRWAGLGWRRGLQCGGGRGRGRHLVAAIPDIQLRRRGAVRGGRLDSEIHGRRGHSNSHRITAISNSRLGRGRARAIRARRLHRDIRCRRRYRYRHSPAIALAIFSRRRRSTLTRTTRRRTRAEPGHGTQHPNDLALSETADLHAARRIQRHRGADLARAAAGDVPCARARAARVLGVNAGVLALGTRRGGSEFGEGCVEGVGLGEVGGVDGRRDGACCWRGGGDDCGGDVVAIGSVEGCGG